MSYFLNQMAEFKRKKRNKIKDAILGRTASGKSFRIGSVISATGVGATMLLNKNAVKKFLRNPLYRYVKKVRPEKHNIEWQTNRQMLRNPKPEKETGFKLDEFFEKKVPYSDGQKRIRTTTQKPRSFMNTGYKIKWDNVAKTSGVAATAIALPVGASYAFGTKKERDRINHGVTSGIRTVGKVSNNVRGWVNTLHRTSK